MCFSQDFLKHLINANIDLKDIAILKEIQNICFAYWHNDQKDMIKVIEGEHYNLINITELSNELSYIGTRKTIDDRIDKLCKNNFLSKITICDKHIGSRSFFRVLHEIE